MFFSFQVYPSSDPWEFPINTIVYAQTQWDQDWSFMLSFHTHSKYNNPVIKPRTHFPIGTDLFSILKLQALTQGHNKRSTIRRRWWVGGKPRWRKVAAAEEEKRREWCPSNIWLLGLTDRSVDRWTDKLPSQFGSDLLLDCCVGLLLPNNNKKRENHKGKREREGREREVPVEYWRRRRTGFGNWSVSIHNWAGVIKSNQCAFTVGTWLSFGLWVEAFSCPFSFSLGIAFPSSKIPFASKWWKGSTFLSHVHESTNQTYPKGFILVGFEET